MQKNGFEHASLGVKSRTENGHNDLYVGPSGFVISDEYPFLGASPDAVVYEPSLPYPHGLAEVKCPFSVRDLTPNEACSKPFFLHIKY